MKYVLMNKYEVLLEFVILEENGFEVAEEVKVYRKPFWINDLTEFLMSRRAPLRRKNMSELVKKYECDTLKGFLNFTHALSLNDTLWVKDKDDKELEWKDMSLYRNKFDEAISQIAFNGGAYGDEFYNLTPELSTTGQFAKCWIRDEKDVYLIKRGSEEGKVAGLEPYSEYYGSQIESLLT